MRQREDAGSRRCPIELRRARREHGQSRLVVLLTVRESISRTRNRTFEQTEVTDKVVLAGIEELKPIMFDDRLDREPYRLIQQGGLLFWDTG